MENKHFCYLQQIQQIQIGTNGNKSVRTTKKQVQLKLYFLLLLIREKKNISKKSFYR